MSYVVIIERGETGYGAYVPGLPGCVAAADTPAEVRHLIGEAIQLHIADLRERGTTIPVPSSLSTTVEIV